MKKTPITVIIITTLLPHLYCHASENIKPHFAITMEELSLQTAIKTSAADPHILDNILIRDQVPDNNRIDYRLYITQNLINSIRIEEKRQLNINCNGKYIANEICGLDYNPITCASDSTKKAIILLLNKIKTPQKYCMHGTK